MKQVVIHSDGGCHGNPGPGGWAAILACGSLVRELSGGDPASTNNRMELQASIEALRALKEPCEVEFFTDSTYVKNGVSAWIANWKRRGWLTASKNPVKNVDLWKALDSEVSRHKIQWKWVRGHSGHHGNERCDFLTQEEIAKIKKALSPRELQDALDQFNATNPAPSLQEDLFSNL